MIVFLPPDINQMLFIIHKKKTRQQQTQPLSGKPETPEKTPKHAITIT